MHSVRALRFVGVRDGWQFGAGDAWRRRGDRWFSTCRSEAVGAVKTAGALVMATRGTVAGPGRSGEKPGGTSGVGSWEAGVGVRENIGKLL